MAATRARNLTMAAPLTLEVQTLFPLSPEHQQGQVSSAIHVIMNPHSAPLRARAAAMAKLRARVVWPWPSFELKRPPRSATTTKLPEVQAAMDSDG
ncbi:hypothetical protein NL676_003597 [Syzygium grande]|nr:hypothetical protein NL676_003597 [Syzygium grande]